MRNADKQYSDRLAVAFVAVSVLALACGVWFVAQAWASPFTCDNVANTCTYRVTAVEPTKTKSGAALANYKQTNIKTSLNGGPYVTLVKPATSPSGGGTITQDVTFATVACAVTKLDVKVSGTNTLNVEGVEAVATGSPVTVDRSLDPLCAPAAPTAGVS